MSAPHLVRIPHFLLFIETANDVCAACPIYAAKGSGVPEALDSYVLHIPLEKLTNIAS